MRKATKKDRQRLAKSLAEVMASPALSQKLYDTLAGALVDLQNETQSFRSLQPKYIPKWVPKALKKERKIIRKQNREGGYRPACEEQ